jgi:hypothetical protein
MKKWILVLLVLAPAVLYGDPHYVQALHPYWGNDDKFLEYLNGFKGPVNADVKTYKGAGDPDVGEDWYIYIYIIRERSAVHFALDIACPDAGSYEIYFLNEARGGLASMAVDGIAKIEEVISSDPIRKNKPAEVDKGKLIWPLDPAEGPQGMWFYSTSPPAKRTYELLIEDGVVRSGSIAGPSCENEQVDNT